MREWTERQAKWWVTYVDLSGRMILPISEMLAIVPYLMRSLRIQKMFEAREIYCDEERIPKQMIWRWKEGSIIKIMVPIILIFGGVIIALGFAGIVSINFNILSIPMQNDGSFSDQGFSQKMGYDMAVISVVSFFEYILLCWAMHAQWYIEREYNIFFEIFLVSCNWFFCNSLSNYIWIFDQDIFGFFIHGETLPLNTLRWIDFACLTLRSLGCILITSLYNIWASFSLDQMILIPPDERSIDQFEMVLHNPVAIDYFYEYLEEQDLNEQLDQAQND